VPRSAGTNGHATVGGTVRGGARGDGPSAHGGGDAVSVWEHVEPGCSLSDEFKLEQLWLVPERQATDSGAIALLKGADGTFNFRDMFVCGRNVKVDVVKGEERITQAGELFVGACQAKIVRRHALGLALLDALVRMLAVCSLCLIQIPNKDKGFERKAEHLVVPSGLLIWQVEHANENQMNTMWKDNLQLFRGAQQVKKPHCFDVNTGWMSLCHCLSNTAGPCKRQWTTSASWASPTLRPTADFTRSNGTGHMDVAIVLGAKKRRPQRLRVN
jgi:hypothetical protein